MIPEKYDFWEIISVLAVMLFITACSQNFTSSNPSQMQDIDTFAQPLLPGENRIYSFTNKKSSYYYGLSHSNMNPDWFAGWNYLRKRIFSDYSVLLNGETQDRTHAKVTVYPDRLVREFADLTEIFSMIDQEELLMLKMNGSKTDRIGLAIHGDRVEWPIEKENYLLFHHQEYLDLLIGIFPINDVEINMIVQDNLPYAQAEKNSDGFFIAIVKSEAELENLISVTRNNYLSWIMKRKYRINNLIQKDCILSSSDPQLNQAINWNRITLDQLIMDQTGKGIYAGLPWFNDYWGRDQFISFNGACLISGQFETAKEILRSFAKYQNTDEDSKLFGRMPNRLRPDDIIYNTTDGTPRFAIALKEYFEYTGDSSLVQELFPSVKRSIEGSLKHWVDEKGYLTHEDADTWMDAKIENTIPWSPRGNRANDIQALWVKQLSSGAFFANLLGQNDLASKWLKLRDKIQRNFNRDFLNKNYPFMADRLDKNNTADFSLRPNQLFAMDLLDDPEIQKQVVKSVWEKLVYPWGVSSLSRDHENFHPFHENWDLYHKDAAYHNGTVWIWNNGIAMQRMLEWDQTDIAYELFRNMSEMTLDMGAIGSLGENTDALVNDEEDWARLTGTFLQAWSSAEYLRVWHEYFVGIRPKASTKTIFLSPLIPYEINDFNHKQKVWAGQLELVYKRNNEEQIFEYKFHDLESEITLVFPKFSFINLQIKAGDKLKVTLEKSKLSYIHTSENGSTHMQFEPNKQKLSDWESNHDYFSGTSFAPVLVDELIPTLLETHYLYKILTKSHD